MPDTCLDDKPAGLYEESQPVFSSLMNRVFEDVGLSARNVASRYASPSYVGDWVYKISCQKASEEEGWFMSVIGEQTMDRILDVTDELQACVHEKFEPYGGVFRLNESGEYVSENDWLNVWGGRPTWWHKAWMLADNGQYTTSAVAAMSVAEIERAYDDPCFEPEYAFYTEVDGNGLP